MNLSLGEWIVKALELFKKSPDLRRMYYWALVVVSLYGLLSLIKEFFSN